MIRALCVPLICLPIKKQPIKVIKEHFVEFRNLEFSETDIEKEIDLLIGSDLYWRFVTGKIVKTDKTDDLVAVETKCGWVLSGSIGNEGGGETQSVNFVSCATIDVRMGGQNGLENELKTFWELESLGNSKNEQSFYEDYFETISRNENNRYE